MLLVLIVGLWTAIYLMIVVLVNQYAAHGGNCVVYNNCTYVPARNTSWEILSNSSVICTSQLNFQPKNDSLCYDNVGANNPLPCPNSNYCQGPSRRMFMKVFNFFICPVAAISSITIFVYIWGRLFPTEQITRRYSYASLQY